MFYFIAQLLKIAQIFFQQPFFLHTQCEKYRRIDRLRGKISGFQRSQHTLIQHLFVGGMLVNNIKLTVKLHQPVSVKKLPDYLMFFPGRHIQKFPSPGCFFFLFQWKCCGLLRLPCGKCQGFLYLLRLFFRRFCLLCLFRLFCSRRRFLYLPVPVLISGLIRAVFPDGTLHRFQAFRLKGFRRLSA